MKIVVLDGYTENPGDLSWGRLEELGEFIVYDRSSLTDEDEVIARIGEAEIVITNKTPITKRVLDSCPSIRYIGVLATGYNVVDYVYAAKKGIPVTNVPGYGTDTVAQFTFALLLEICHRVAHHSEAVHAGPLGAEPGLLLLRLSPDRTGRQDHGYHRIWPDRPEGRNYCEGIWHEGAGAFAS